MEVGVWDRRRSADMPGGDRRGFVAVVGWWDMSGRGPVDVGVGVGDRHGFVEVGVWDKNRNSELRLGDRHSQNTPTSSSAQDTKIIPGWISHSGELYKRMYPIKNGEKQQQQQQKQQIIIL